MIHAIISCPSTPQKETKRSSLIPDRLHGDLVGHQALTAAGLTDAEWAPLEPLPARGQGHLQGHPLQSRRAAARDCRCPSVTSLSWTARNCSPGCGTTGRACGSCPAARCQRRSHLISMRSGQPDLTPTASGPPQPGSSRPIRPRRASPDAAGRRSPRHCASAARRADATPIAAGRRALALTV